MRNSVENQFMRNLLTRSIVSLAITLGIASCGQGTGTGNPFSSGQSHPLPSFSTVTDKIGYHICLGISRCHTGVGIVDCSIAIRPSTDYAAKLGLTLNPTPSLSEIAQMEVNEVIVPSTNAANLCLSKMSLLTCADPVVQSAYNSAAIGAEFALAHEILDPVCQGVFGSP